MPENGTKIEVINFNNYTEKSIEYHFNVDVQVLFDSETGEASIGWARPGSAVSELWRKDAEYGEEDY